MEPSYNFIDPMDTFDLKPAMWLCAICSIFFYKQSF